MRRHIIGSQRVTQTNVVIPLDDGNKHRCFTEPADGQLAPAVNVQLLYQTIKSQGRGFPRLACWSDIQESNSLWGRIW
jgi:hypothetical protein